MFESRKEWVRRSEGRDEGGVRGEVRVWGREGKERGRGVGQSPYSHLHSYSQVRDTGKHR